MLSRYILKIKNAIDILLLFINEKIVLVESPVGTRINKKFNNKVPKEYLAAKVHLIDFESKIQEIIDDMESKIEDSLPSCKQVMMEIITEILANSIEEAKKWNDTFNFEERAHVVIYNTASNLLISGRFHLYRGFLNPYNESTHLIGVCRQCLEWLQTNGYIDESKKIEQLQIIWDEIQQVG